MKRWYEALPGVHGKVPLSDGTLASWPDQAMEGRLQHLSFCPVALSEMYLLAQHLPMTVLEGPAGPELVADLRPDRLQWPVFDVQGKLNLPYRPLALRMLPFFVEADGEVWRLADTAGESGPSRPPELQKRLCSILAAQAQGRSRMRASLIGLIDEGFLVPASTYGTSVIGELVIETQALSTKNTFDDFLGLRLLNILLFSMNKLKSRIVHPDADMYARLSLARDDRLRKRQFVSDSELIDFEKLLRG